MPKLKRLVFDCNEIRGTDLAHLCGQSELIDLSTGIDEPAKSLPKCKIEWDGGVIEPQGASSTKPK